MAACVPDEFSNFNLEENHQIANYSTATDLSIS
jgi:hypothetical protein